MAGYDSTKLRLVLEAGIGGAGPAIWTHESSDAGSVAQVTGYITDGGSRGMKVGDIVIHTDNDASPPAASTLLVASVSSTYPGAVDLVNATVLTATSNSD